VIFVLWWNVTFDNRMIPGLYLGDMAVGGQTKSQIEKASNDRFAKFKNDNNQIQLYWQDKNTPLTLDSVDTQIDTGQTVNSAYQIGHTKNWFKNTYVGLKSIAKHLQIPIAIQFNSDKLGKYIDELSNSYNVLPKNATLEIKELIVTVVPSSKGSQLQVDDLQNKLKYNIGSFDSAKMELPMKDVEPSIKEEDTQKAKQIAEQMFSAPIKIVYQDIKYTANPAQIADWNK